MEYYKDKIDILKFFTERYPKYFGPKRGTSDCLVFYKNGKETDQHTKHISNGCHGFLGYLGQKEEMTAVYSSLWCDFEDNYENSKAYWDFLFDPVLSPYRKVLKDVDIIKDKEGRYVAFGLRDMTAPIQLCAGICIQSRVPREAPAKAAAFKFLVDAGLEKWEAFFASELIVLHEGLFSFVKYSSHAFSGTVGVSAKRVRDGDPHISNQGTWKTGGRIYYPVNSVWSGTGSKKLMDVLKADEKYDGFFKTLFRKNVSPDLKFREKGCIPAKDVAQAIKDNRDKWII